jgi:hypothetical protein
MQGKKQCSLKKLHDVVKAVKITLFIDVFIEKHLTFLALYHLLQRSLRMPTPHRRRMRSSSTRSSVK